MKGGSAIYTVIRLRLPALLCLLALAGLLLRPVQAVPVSSAPAPAVYLTYDDGPSTNTEALLQVLREEQVPATFFLIGETDESLRPLYRRIALEGHTIGVHSNSHVYEEIYRSAGAFLEDFRLAEERIRRWSGVQPRIYRFPGGSVSRVAEPSVLREAAAVLAREGYSCFDWNALAGDDTPAVLPPEELARNVETSAAGKDPVVVLFHDAALCRTTPEATRMVIGYFRERGYRFLALTPDSPPVRFLAVENKKGPA